MMSNGSPAPTLRPASRAVCSGCSARAGVAGPGCRLPTRSGSRHFAVVGIVINRCLRRAAATSTRSSTDRASDYGSEGWEFESLRVRQFDR
jgi:hypothetical protein